MKAKALLYFREKALLLIHTGHHNEITGKAFPLFLLDHTNIDWVGGSQSKQSKQWLLSSLFTLSAWNISRHFEQLLRVMSGHSRSHCVKVTCNVVSPLYVLVAEKPKKSPKINLKCYYCVPQQTKILENQTLKILFSFDRVSPSICIIYTG